MFTYSQKTGLLSQDGVALGYGYAGRGKGLNNPGYEMVKNIGPLPKGEWEFGIWHKSKEFGPIVCYLRPVGGQNVYGRGGFMIHGDNKKMNYTASEGCIVLSRNLRIKVRDSGEKTIVVTQ